MSRALKPPAAITILHVAAEAGVSKSTVSLVLKDSSLIPAETSQRVRDAAKKLGYVYNRRAAEMRLKSSNTIGVVINDLMNPFFAEVLIGIEKKLVEAGYIVFMAHTNESLEMQNKVLLSMREQNAAGIVICPAIGTTNSMPKLLNAWGIPLTVMVRTVGKGSYDFAGADNERGIYLATRHLLDAGHRRIGFLGGIPGVTQQQRITGYQAALAESSIAFDPQLVICANPNRQGGHDTLCTLLDMSPHVTAAVAYNDIVAFGALSVLGKRGLRAGKDFALIGFDNVLDAAHSNPPLSTVDTRPSELGEQAAAILLARIAEPNRARQTYLAVPRLVMRQSA